MVAYSPYIIYALTLMQPCRWRQWCVDDNSLYIPAMNCLLLLNLLTVVLLHLQGEAGAAPSRNGKNNRQFATCMSQTSIILYNYLPRPILFKLLTLHSTTNFFLLSLTASMCATPPPMMLTQCLRMVYNGCRSVNCCQPHCLQDCSNNREVTRNSIIMACLSESIQNSFHCIVDIRCNVSSTETTLSSECISAYQFLCRKLPRNHSPATNGLVNSCRQVCIATRGSNSTSRLSPMTCRRVSHVYCRHPSNMEECTLMCVEDDSCVRYISDSTIIIAALPFVYSYCNLLLQLVFICLSNPTRGH